MGKLKGHEKRILRRQGRYALGLLLIWTAAVALVAAHGFQPQRKRALSEVLTASISAGVSPAEGRRQPLTDVGGYLGLWLLGMAGLWQGERRVRRQIAATHRSHRLRRQVRKRLSRLSHYDPLTGLPNRLLFSDRLRQNLASARRSRCRMAVAVLGLNHFRTINHSYGLGEGDLVLKEAAARLTSCLRSEDTVARLGDGRFLLLFPHIRNGDNAALLARKIQEIFLPPFTREERELYLTVSLGIAMWPEDGEEEEELVRNADTALSLARDQGGSFFRFYTASMNERAVARVTLENQLRRALELDQLRLVFQPQIDLRSGAVVGAEALLRWRHPELGDIPPDRFIPVAEDTGQILAIGEWVLRNACRESSEWERLAGRSVAVAVNLSPRQFRDAGLVKLIEEVLEETGLRPESLELEIVESSIIHEVDRAIETLTRLKRRGIKVAIDDFGTGYSSLSYLKQLPIDRIKIDRSFVSDLDSGCGGAAIVELIVEIARKMGVDSIAEGVETAGQKNLLQAFNCHLMQGYLFSPPLTADDFSALLRSASAGISLAV